MLLNVYLSLLFTKILFFTTQQISAWKKPYLESYGYSPYKDLRNLLE